MKKKIKVGISGIDPFSGNKGVAALGYSTLYLLNRIAEEHNKQIDITIITNTFGENVFKIGKESIKTKSIESINIFSLKGVIKFVLNPKLFKSTKEYLGFNYLLSMGAGDSFSDIYGKKRFKNINSQHKIARLLKIKYVLLPQTIGPFKDNKVKRQAHKSIKKSICVLARDFQSFDYVCNNTQQKNIFEVIDVAFFMPYERHSFSNGSTHVGINISSLLWHGGYTENNQFGLKANYIELTRSIIDYFLSFPNVTIHIVPHVVHNQSNIENDYEVSLNLVNEYRDNRIILAPFFLTPILAKNYISGLDFFIGGRMHATIAAFSSSVPVFPLAYSRKFNGLFKDTLNYNYMADMTNENNNQILCNIKEAYSKRILLKNLINERMDSVVKEKETLLNKKMKEIFDLS